MKIIIIFITFFLLSACEPKDPQDQVCIDRYEYAEMLSKQKIEEANCSKPTTIQCLYLHGDELMLKKYYNEAELTRRLNECITNLNSNNEN